MEIEIKRNEAMKTRGFRIPTYQYEALSKEAIKKGADISKVVRAVIDMWMNQK
jgi:hypothetical protein